jgi:carboxyl-terminal processing protease
MPAIPVEPDRSALSDAIAARHGARPRASRSPTSIPDRTSARFYGNVGSRKRLDFPVIGPVVDEAKPHRGHMLVDRSARAVSAAFAAVGDMKRRLPWVGITVHLGYFVLTKEPVAVVGAGTQVASSTKTHFSTAEGREVRRSDVLVGNEQQPKGSWMMRKTSLILLGAVAGAALTLMAVQPSRLMVATSASAAGAADTYHQLNLFGDIFEMVRSHYVEKPDDSKLVEGAVNGMLNGLDPHSSYMDPKSFRDMQVETHGEFGGLGIEVTMEDGLVKVVTPIDDTPAAKAGIRAGDMITHIDDEAVQGLTLNQAVEKMRGPVNIKIKLKILRKGVDKPLDIAINRETIRVRSVRGQNEGNDVGYVRITQFNEQVADGLRKAINDITNQLGADKVKGYVIDLRNNPGGLLDQAISVSDAFLERGEIVSTRGRDPEETLRVNARPGDLTKGKPVIVLINGGSASASEIVAGALQDHRRATLVGTRSFGKGSVQTIIPMGSGNGALRLTTARYFTPSGRSIQAKGITPDIEVLQDVPEEIQARAALTETQGESSLRGHLKAEGDEQGGSQSYVPPEAKDDKALNMALDLIRGTKINPAFPPNPKSATLPN